MLAIATRLLPHFDDRPPDVVIDTLVIHSMFAAGEIDPLDPLACIETLDRCKVSAHYLIGQRGETWQLVHDEKRAWHAGVSRMPGPDDQRENVNHFSIGIELAASPEAGFSRKQYETLAILTAELLQRHPIRRVLGHDHIAPGRKVDPGDTFDWAAYHALVLARIPGREEVVFGPG